MNSVTRCAFSHFLSSGFCSDEIFLLLLWNFDCNYCRFRLWLFLCFVEQVVALVIATIAGTLLWDRLCTAVFAPRVFGAIMSEASKTTVNDLYPILLTAAKVAGVIVLLGTGNILLIGGAIWWYRSYSAKQANPLGAPGAAGAAATAGGGVRK